MSWESYINTLTIEESNGFAPVAEAAICGFDPGQESVWAQKQSSAVISVEEIKKLRGDRSGIPQNGVHLWGQKCRLIRDQLDTDGVFLLDLKTAPDSEGNTYSVCVGKSNKAFVILKGTKDANGGHLSTRVFKVVEHLRKAQY